MMTSLSLLPIVISGLPSGCCYAKMESENLTGSMKIRSARKILDSIDLGKFEAIVESTSGNMGVALSVLCKERGISCVLVVDPKLSPWHRDRMLENGAKLIDVVEMDSTGGWLSTRLKKVTELLVEHKNWFWVNQYENKNNPLSFEEIGKELYIQLNLENCFRKIVYLFASVSTGGSLTGTARSLKSLAKVKGHTIKVVAVDAKGSAIFGESPCKRYLNGIGSSISNPKNLDRSLIDFVSIVDDEEAFKACYTLRRNGFYVGGSSGAVFSAIRRMGRKIDLADYVVGIFPDHGLIYNQTIYSENWLLTHGFDVAKIREEVCVG